MTDFDKESQSHMVELQLTKSKSSVQRVARLQVAKVELRAEIFMQPADQAIQCSWRAPIKGAWPGSIASNDLTNKHTMAHRV